MVIVTFNTYSTPNNLATDIRRIWLCGSQPVLHQGSSVAWPVTVYPPCSHALYWHLKIIKPVLDEGSEFWWDGLHENSWYESYSHLSSYQHNIIIPPKLDRQNCYPGQVTPQKSDTWINVNCPKLLISNWSPPPPPPPIIVSHFSRHLSPHSCSPVLWSDWLLWEVTVYQTLGNSIIRTLYWNYIHFDCANTQSNTQMHSYADTPTTLPQVNGMHGCTRSRHIGLDRQTERRDTQMDAHTCQMLSLFHLLSINQILTYLGNLVPGSGEECLTSPLQTTSLPTHCVNLDDIINMHHSPEQDQALLTQPFMVNMWN